MKHDPDLNTEKIRKWLKKSKRNVTRLADYIQKEGHLPHGIGHILSGDEFKGFRKEIRRKFKIN